MAFWKIRWGGSIAWQDLGHLDDNDPEDIAHWWFAERCRTNSVGINKPCAIEVLNENDNRVFFFKVTLIPMHIQVSRQIACVCCNSKPAVRQCSFQRCEGWICDDCTKGGECLSCAKMWEE